MGQAGLRDGNTRLQNLLGHLKVLIKDYETVEFVGSKLRSDIYENWKYVFSSEPHENYRDLLEKYNEKKRNNELKSIHLDPYLIGQNKIINKSIPGPSKQHQPEISLVENSNIVLANVVKIENNLFKRQSIDAMSSCDVFNKKEILSAHNSSRTL